MFTRLFWSCCSILSWARVSSPKNEIDEDVKRAIVATFHALLPEGERLNVCPPATVASLYECYMAAKDLTGEEREPVEYFGDDLIRLARRTRYALVEVLHQNGQI
jgi:hypothetical protein